MQGTTWKRQMPLPLLNKGKYNQSGKEIKMFSIISAINHISWDFYLFILFIFFFFFFGGTSFSITTIYRSLSLVQQAIVLYNSQHLWPCGHVYVHNQCSMFGAPNRYTPSYTPCILVELTKHYWLICTRN